MSRNQFTRSGRLALCALALLCGVGGCEKPEDTPRRSSDDNKPKADFSFTVRNPGTLPTTVAFQSTSTGATTLAWTFGNGTTSTATNPEAVFPAGTVYNVKLVATNAFGKDSVTKAVSITLSRPVANFTFATSDPRTLPVTLTATNTSTGSNVTYRWTLGSTTSTQTNLTTPLAAGGLYNLKLVASNAAGRDSVTKPVRLSPYPQAYTSFNGTLLNLYAWEGSKVTILSRSSALNRATMYRWLAVADSTYSYYRQCTGREPSPFAPTYLNGRTTIADVPATCGAGCGYLGATGIEMATAFFDDNYRVINDFNQFDHLGFYESGRNFWFYGGKLNYKEPGSFPIAGAYAVWMGSMEGRDVIGVPGCPVNGETYAQAKARFANFLNLYLADPTLNWTNTLAVDRGVPGQCNAADLFTSMCMRLKRDYGGLAFQRNLWRNVALRPDAVTTQDAVDNFFLAACATANRNLTSLFQTWRFPLSGNAVAAAARYP